MEIANEQIFEKLFRDHYSLLCNYACRYIADSQVAEDIVQTFFISIWEKKHLLRKSFSLMPIGQLKTVVSIIISLKL